MALPTCLDRVIGKLQVGQMVGVFWSASVAVRLTKTGNQPAFQQTLPLLEFCLVFSLSMLWLIVG